MATSPEGSYQPAGLLRALVDGLVDFVIIGGVAVVLQALPRFTRDLDIAYALDRENLDRLGVVLVSLRARLRGIDDDLPFVPDGRTLRTVQILTLTTDLGELDLLGSPDGAPEYHILRDRAETMELADRSVRVASIEDLLAMKRAAGRPQDLIDIDGLEAARERRTL